MRATASAGNAAASEADAGVAAGALGAACAGFILKQYEEQPETLGGTGMCCWRAGRGEGTLIGAVGGFPKPDGDVEIGYSTLPAFQRQGYGTAAAQKLVEWLLTAQGCASVSAQTFRGCRSREGDGAVRDELVGEGDEPETVRYRRMR